MPKKKQTPPISPGTLPKEMNFKPLPNGDLSFEMVTDFMSVKGTLVPDYAVAVLGKWVADIYEKARSGGSFEDTPFAKAGIELHPNEGKYTDEELDDVLDRFIRIAVTQAVGSILVRMAKLPAQVLIEGIISVVLDMEESEIIKITGSRADIWNGYVDEVGRTIKREFNVPTVVKPRHWNKQMERKALKLYESTFVLLDELKGAYFSSSSEKIRRQRPDLKPWDEVMDEHPHLRHILRQLDGRGVRELCVEYVGECFGSASEHTTWDHIKNARRDRRRSEKARAGWTPVS